MQALINIAFSLALMFWFGMLMMSPMMFDAPGSENDKSHLVTMMVILCYPIGLFLLLWLFGGSYFGVSGLKMAVVSAVVIAIAFSTFGYFGRLYNLQSGIANTGYSVVGNKVYFDGTLIGADGESFKILDNEERDYFTSAYALDKYNLYYNGKKVEGANQDKLKKMFIHRDLYLLNSTQVIYDGNILPQAQPDHFGGFDTYAGWSYSLSSDQYRVFSFGVPLPAVDKLTFTPLNDHFAKDKDHIFKKQNLILAEADAATFTLLEDNNFAKDKNYVYYLATKTPFAIKDADPTSFEVLDRGYIRDKNSIYHVIQYESIEKLEYVDPSSFEATPYDDATKSEAKDINHYYYDGKIVGDRK